jgi:hypothetical protein
MKKSRVVRQTLNLKGQSTIEFALTMILLMAFTLFYVQISLAFSFGSFVHYATFMSARALLASGPNQSDQYARAKQVIIYTLKKSEGEPGLDKFPSIAKAFGQGDLPGYIAGPGKQFQSTDISYSWMLGVQYKFRSKVFLLPLGKSKTTASNPTSRVPANTLELTAESWLGMEASDSDCREQMSKGSSQSGGGGWRTDNGC